LRFSVDLYLLRFSLGTMNNLDLGELNDSIDAILADKGKVIMNAAELADRTYAALQAVLTALKNQGRINMTLEQKIKDAGTYGA